MEAGNIIFAFVNSLLSILTIISNLLVLMAVKRAPNLHKPSHILLCNLALADLGVGLLTQPTFVASIMTGRRLKILLDTGILLFGGISLVGITLVLLDRYYALHLHLRYQVVVTNRKTVAVVVVLWATSVVPLAIFLLRPGIIHLVGFLGGLSCVITSIVTYIKMYGIIRRHRRQIMAESVSRGSHTTQRENSKSVKTSVFVQLVFILSWLPVMMVAPVRHWIKSKQAYDIYFRFAVTVFLSKSLANPVLYCWRVQEIRKAMMDVTSKIIQSMSCHR